MNAKSFHFTVQGASHIKKNKECQDWSDSFQDESYSIAIVCDGHGGDDYIRSAIGSKIGCGVAMKNIKNFLNGIDKKSFFENPERHLKNLEASIINGWNESIAIYHGNQPFNDEELSIVSEKTRKKYVDEGRIESAYGTTMIAVAMNQDYWFGIHIGDGKCVAINPEGEFKQPIPWDPKCFLNATTSICDSDAIDRFRHFYSEKLPAAVFVGSDGVDDCFSNNEQLHNLYKTVLFSFATTDFKEASDGLADYLPRLSAKGSGDDVSVAAILDMDLIPGLSIVREFDREKEKARVEENARKEAEKNEAEKRRVEEEHARFQQQNNAKAETNRLGNTPKFCEDCGERLKPGAKFCSNCGTPIKPHVSQNNPSARQERVQVIKLSPFFTEPEQELDVVDNEAAVAMTDVDNDQAAAEDSVVQQMMDDGVRAVDQQDIEALEEESSSENADKFDVDSDFSAPEIEISNIYENGVASEKAENAVGDASGEDAQDIMIDMKNSDE